MTGVNFAFLIKLMDGIVSGPELSELVTANANPYPITHPHRNPLTVPNHTTSYGDNEPITRMLLNLNRLKNIAMTYMTWRTKKS